MKICAALLVFFAGNSSALSNGFPGPNRGTQLFVVIGTRHIGTYVIAMAPAKRSVLHHWNPHNGTYDFVSAVVHHTATGCRVGFTRYVMADDYIPRVEHLDLAFPYTQQPHYQFFDIGSILGFYRNSTEDFAPAPPLKTLHT